MKHAATLVGERRLGTRWSVQLAVGAAIAGELSFAGAEYQKSCRGLS